MVEYETPSCELREHLGRAGDLADAEEQRPVQNVRLVADELLALAGDRVWPGSYVGEKADDELQRLILCQPARWVCANGGCEQSDDQGKQPLPVRTGHEDRPDERTGEDNELPEDHHRSSAGVCLCKCEESEHRTLLAERHQLVDLRRPPAGAITEAFVGDSAHSRRSVTDVQCADDYAGSEIVEGGRVIGGFDGVGRMTGNGAGCIVADKNLAQVVVLVDRRPCAYETQTAVKNSVILGPQTVQIRLTGGNGHRELPDTPRTHAWSILV